MSSASGIGPCWRAAALALALILAATGAAGQRFAEDVAAARAVFEANLAAIAARDRDAYLACYLDSERLARTGPEGSRWATKASPRAPARAGPRSSRPRTWRWCRSNRAWSTAPTATACASMG